MTHWADDAACSSSGLHPSAWDHDATYEQHVAAAKVCGYCPVAMDCLAAGIADREYGVRAGQLLVAGKPRRVTRPVEKGRRAQCGTRSGYVAHRARHEAACVPCREAEAAYSREYKRNWYARTATKVAAGTVTVPHGTATGYCSYACRCEDCFAAVKTAKRERRARRRGEDAA